MQLLNRNNFFWVIGCIATMKHLLRRSIQGSLRYSGFISRKDAKTSQRRKECPINVSAPYILKSLRPCVESFVLLFLFIFPWFNSNAQRLTINLNENWETSLVDTNDPITIGWKKVNIPHNWDDYYGYRRLLHGNLHGDAVYKKDFTIKQNKSGKRFFLFFEGVGSYATVFLNNKNVGSHAGGRTTFTLDVTDAIKTDGTKNELQVKASHPANIRDLPWVCGGCSEERGFSEGSQPLGVFRPVHLIVTSDARIEPFGVHAYASIDGKTASLTINTTLENYSGKERNLFVHTQLHDQKGRIIMEDMTGQYFVGNDSLTIKQGPHTIKNIELWSPEQPRLYKIVSYIKENSRVIDKIETSFGFRTINWKTPANQFLVNGKPVFINGVAEYEHVLGQSHAFSNEQIISRMKWIKAAGFNAFRDGHQPHNLLYGKQCNEKGILWWTQISAHVWYNTPEFRNNFKQLLKEWVIERRNDPSVVLWGLQNESKLPEDFARECTELIRSLDPTTSTQRLVTTCNGGEGTDWNVPQNWTGTYGGDPKTYGDDLKKQVLVGEYGAWRTIDLHTEGGFAQNGVLSEDRMTQLMEQKVRLAESVKDSVAGHIFWLLTSHDNPGRVQGGEGLRELDRIGPVNYKGLLTPWEEPTDAFYMFRSNYASKVKEPMVYIVSHTWPNRWMTPGIKDSIYVYSNCDEVELFNDIGHSSLGKRKRNGIGTHFQWDKVNIQYNVLYAVGYVNGKAVARDTLTLFHLPQSPNFNKLYAGAKNLTKPEAGFDYKFRINCGGPGYTDENGSKWEADDDYSYSWTDDFDEMPINFASQRRTFSPIKGTKDWKLFQTFRYGKNKLKYEFPLPDGEYLVELYFTEPWLGIGGGINAGSMRLFDVAINGHPVLDDLDIWKEAGTNTALKKTVKVLSGGGKLIISFPESKAGQALVSAIAIASKKPAEVKLPDKTEPRLDLDFETWLDIGDRQYGEEHIQFNYLPSFLYGADWVRFQNRKSVGKLSSAYGEETFVYVAVRNELDFKDLLKDFENTQTKIITDENGGTTYNVFRKRFSKGESVKLDVDARCIVAMQRVSNMQPAYDLKSITQYRTNVAIVDRGVVKDSVNGRFCVVIRSNETVIIDYPVHTGVADIYSMTMKYFYDKQNPVKGRLQLIGAGNTMMLDEEIHFNFTNIGKWNQFTINTGSMINAGNYIVRLVINGAEALAISSVDIQ